FSSRRRHTSFSRDWSSDVCSSDLLAAPGALILAWLLALKLGGEDIGGRPLLLAGVMLVLIGMQLIVAGLVGELLTRIYHEGRGTPQYHVREPRARELAPDREA